MNELVIEDKKYISSKRAAQVTGYAKDYIGQLCREGRVPARLVGRNWYVLESALTDHRFKTPQKEEKGTENVRAESVAHMSSGWESPRYEAISAKEVPVLKRIEHIESKREVQKEAPEVPLHLHEAWQAWFDHIASQPQTIKEESTATMTEETIGEDFEEKANERLTKSDEREEGEKSEESNGKKEETNVPIRAIHHTPLNRSEQHHKIEQSREGEKEDQGRGVTEYRNSVHVGKRSSTVLPFQIAGTLLALIMAAFAGLSTGYFDSSIASLKPASLIAGVSMYQK